MLRSRGLGTAPVEALALPTLFTPRPVLSGPRCVLKKAPRRPITAETPLTHHGKLASAARAGLNRVRRCRLSPRMLGRLPSLRDAPLVDRFVRMRALCRLIHGSQVSAQRGGPAGASTPSTVAPGRASPRPAGGLPGRNLSRWLSRTRSGFEPAVEVRRAGGVRRPVLLRLARRGAARTQRRAQRALGRPAPRRPREPQPAPPSTRLTLRVYRRTLHSSGVVTAPGTQTGFAACTRGHAGAAGTY